MSLQLKTSIDEFHKPKRLQHKTSIDEFHKPKRFQPLMNFVRRMDLQGFVRTKNALAQFRKNQYFVIVVLQVESEPQFTLWVMWKKWEEG